MNLDKLIRPNIKRLKPYASARDEYQGKSQDMIFIDANENPFPTNVNRYPDPHQRLLKLELARLKKVEPEQILLGNGSDETLDLIFRAFCEPKVDNVITLPPTYGMYEVLANINDIDILEVPLLKNFEPNTNKVLNTFNNHSKLLFLCSPNNPTANSFNAKSVEELIENFPGIVVIDEAYIDFSSKESWLNRLNEYPNLVVTQTYSKALGMAGIRLGVCYASDAIISVLTSIKPPYNVNVLTQQLALQKLEDIRSVESDIENILNERAQLILQLQDISFVDFIFPSDANFILVKVDDANKRYDQLIQKGIVVRNRSRLPGCENCLRFTVGNPNENQILINTLKQL